MVKMIAAAVQFEFELLWGVAGDSGQLITELMLISPTLNLNLNQA